MAPSIKHLSEYLSQRITVRFIQLQTIIPPERRRKVSIYGPTCLSLICYAIKLRSDMSDVIRQLNDLSAIALHEPTSWQSENNIFKLFLNSFVPHVQVFFNVPNLEQLSEKDKSLEKNEILAGFMDFLLQILNCEASSNRDKKQRYAVLQKELSYLLAFLGDIPFQCTDHLDEVKNLLAEFEIVANEAGSFIYSCIFAIPPVRARSFHALNDALLEKVELFNVRIKEHCSKLLEIPTSRGIPRTDAVDSLFIVNSLLADLENMINGQFDLPVDDIRDQIKIAHQELTFSRTLLKDIKLINNTITDEVKESFLKIRDVAYEAEYLINSHVAGNVPFWYLSLRLPAIIHKIKVVATRLPETKKVYDGEVLQVSKYYSGQVSSQRTRLTAVVDHLVVGFEGNTIKFLGDLIGGPEELNIISIFGMPGLGKTTIANKLYNDRAIYDHFDLRAWCVVSQTYMKRNVLIDIFMSIARMPDEDKISKMEVEALGLEIYQILKGRRYLIILDDVWNPNVWDDLRRYFPNDVNGSRIMFTSRIKDTAPKNSIFHSVPPLTKIQCWDLLEKKVFHDEPCPPHLVDIGKCIAVKCNGLPLAVVVIGGILANLEKEESVWKRVERNIDSYIFDDPSRCMKILELSFEHLPDHLKLCFLYFGVFHEDTKFPTRKLMCLWIAEGFIKNEEEQSQEDVAEQYLIDLINRSLLLIAERKSDGGIKACRIHDLLRDMCLRKAHEEKFLNFVKDHSSIYERCYRLSMHSTSPSSWRHFGLHIRSILGHFSDPSSRFPQMALLRVMDLLRTESVFYKMERIDLLVHLRYLGVDRMPEQIVVGNLPNLEFFCIEIGPVDLNIKIPSVFLKMLKLRHIFIKSKAKFEQDWDTCQTTNLKSLSYVCIYEQRDAEILGCSPHLRKLKCICNGQLFPDLRSFAELESLKMVFDSQFKGDLAKINFPSTIKKLTLCKIGLPWEEMSIVGILPNLHVLKLLSDAFVGEEWKTRDGEFQELRFLKLDFFSLRQWITESDHFPKLECVVLRRCWGKVEIPSELGDVPTLKVIEVRGCSYETGESAAQIKKEQLENGNEELKVIISD